MLEKPVEAEIESNPAQSLTRGAIVLTEAIWTLLRRDATLADESDSYVIREILGAHYGLHKDFIQPPRKSRGRKRRDSQ
jgi:hypothetical protein